VSSERIKILHVVISLNPGGMENGVVNVARELPADRYEVHVCCLERTGPFAARLPQPENVHVLHKPPGFSLRAVWKLNRLIARLRPHVIHTHNLGPLIYGNLATFGGRTRPILHGEHNTLAADELTPRRLRQRATLYRGCRRIHAVAEGVRAQLVGLNLSPEKIMTLLNGVDTEKFCPTDRRNARKKIGVAADALVLGIVGRFAPAKSHALLLAAFEQLTAEFPQAHLLIVGTGGSEEAKVRALAAASPATAKLHFAGFQNEMLPYYQALDALIVPSVLEGLSNAVLEAMACGVPVIAQPTCGNPEAITSGVDGVLAPVANAAELAALLRAWLAQPTRLAVLGLAAREKMLAKFRLADMAARYRQTYEELLPAH
jgi:glycosyltransferase involved in cell wall biosynthesis